MPASNSARGRGAAAQSANPGIRTKRPGINDIIARGDAFIRGFGHILPPFACWEPEKIAAPEAAPIRARGLCRDITDHGDGRFDETGLFLFTTRNGTMEALETGGGMLYAEKTMISRRDPLSPMHGHNVKAEDIINRGGSALVIELFAPDAEGNIDPETVPYDGVLRTMRAGGLLHLKPGGSVTLMPGVQHAFRAEGADCLIGAVSTVNDKRTDNVFREPIGRFSQIEEDVDPVHLLVSDYA